MVKKYSKKNKRKKGLIRKLSKTSEDNLIPVKEIFEVNYNSIDQFNKKTVNELIKRGILKPYLPLDTPENESVFLDTENESSFEENYNSLRQYMNDKLKSGLNILKNSSITQKGLGFINRLKDPSHYEGIKENIQEKINFGKKKIMQVPLIGNCSLEDIVQIREEGGPLIDSFEPLKYELTKQRDWKDVKEYFKGNMLRKTLPLATLMMLGLGDSSTQIYSNNLNNLNLEGIARADALYVASGNSLINEDPNIAQVGGISDWINTPPSYVDSEETNLSVGDMVSDSQERLNNTSMAEVNTPNEHTLGQENPNEFRVYHFGEEGDGVNSLLGLANKYYPGIDPYVVVASVLNDNPVITNPNIISKGQRIVLDVNGYNAQFKGAAAREAFVEGVGNANGLTFNDYMIAAGVDINNPEEVRVFIGDYNNAERTSAGGSTNSELSQETFEEVILENKENVPVQSEAISSPIKNNENNNPPNVESNTPISFYNPRNIVKVVPSQEDLNGYGVLMHWNPRGVNQPHVNRTAEIVPDIPPVIALIPATKIPPLEITTSNEYNHAEVLEMMNELNNPRTQGSIGLYSLMEGRLFSETPLIEVSPETESFKIPRKLIGEIKEMYGGLTDFFSNFSEHWGSHLEAIPFITINPEIEIPEAYIHIPMSMPFERSIDIQYPNPISARDIISDSLPSGIGYRLNLESLNFGRGNIEEGSNGGSRNSGIQIHNPRGNGVTSSTHSTSSNGLGYWNIGNTTQEINFEELNYAEITVWADTVIKDLKSLTLEMDTLYSNNVLNITIPAQETDTTDENDRLGLNASNYVMSYIPPISGLSTSEEDLISADSSNAEARRRLEFRPSSSFRDGLPLMYGVTVRPLNLSIENLQDIYVSDALSRYIRSIELDTLNIPVTNILLTPDTSARNPLIADTPPYTPTPTPPVSITPLERVEAQQDTIRLITDSLRAREREINNEVSVGLKNNIENMVRELSRNNSSSGLAELYNLSESGSGSINAENYQEPALSGSTSTSSSGIGGIVSSRVVDVVDIRNGIEDIYVNATPFVRPNEFNFLDIYRTTDNQLEIVIRREFGETGLLNDYNLRIFSENGTLVDERNGSFNNNSSVTVTYLDLASGNYTVRLGSNGYSEDGIKLNVLGEWESERIRIDSNPVEVKTQLDKGLDSKSELPGHLVNYELTNDCPSTGGMWIRPVGNDKARFKEEIDRMIEKREENKHIA